MTTIENHNRTSCPRRLDEVLTHWQRRHHAERDDYNLGMGTPDASPAPAPSPAKDATSLRDISPQQWKSGAAAWLGWMFDGLDMHLYTLVAAPFVMQLVHAASVAGASVKQYSAYIQASFLIGSSGSSTAVDGLMNRSGSAGSGLPTSSA